MPFATSLLEQGTVVGPSAVACSNAASRSAGRIGAVLAELQVGSVFTQLLAPVGAAQPVLQRSVVQLATLATPTSRKLPRVIAGFVATSMNTQLPALNVLIVRHEDRVVRRVVDRRPVDRDGRAPRDLAHGREV